MDTPIVKQKKLKEKRYKKVVSTTMPMYNEEFIKLLKELESFMISTGQPFRARAYHKAAEMIMIMQTPITSLEQVKGKPGIGSTILEKLQEYLDTGKILALEKHRSNPIHTFTKIYGVGPKKAQAFINLGIKSLDELRQQPDLLNTSQKLGLQYYDDLQLRIPREEIEEYKLIFDEEFDYDDAEYHIVGSYRRGVKNSGDIDVILTNNEPSILKKFVKRLRDRGVILHILADGKKKNMVIGQLEGKPARRLDFLYSPREEYPFALLYFTGSATFNVVMRQKALTMNYTLNEHGLRKMVGKVKGDKVEQVFTSEKDIFDFLNMEYKEPTERKNGLVEVTQSIKESSLSMKKNTTLKQYPKEELNNEELITQFQQEGISVLEPLSNNILGSMIVYANERYYNSTPVLSDNQYDIIKEFLEKQDPKHKALKGVGAPVDRKKVDLPYEMWSMDKIKPTTDALDKWNKKYDKPLSYVISAKLDGVSGLYVLDKSGASLYTRGNGKVGQNINHLIPYISVPTDLGDNEMIVIRGEFLISKDNFETHFVGASNPRNTVSGLVNSLTVDKKKVQFLDFVSYECIVPELDPLEQMKFLQDSDSIACVLYEESKILTNEYLSALLVEWRSSYIYEIDGIIVTHNKIYPRKASNPEHAFAFKMVLSDQIAEAKVVDVLWAASKDGYLKPRIRIEPISLGGVTIEYATAFNAAFIEKNKLGIGSVVKLIRSGDVIPYIMEVVVPAPDPKMPTEEYIWTDTKVDIVLKNSDMNPQVQFKRILSFFVTLEVAGLGPGNLQKIIDAGFDTVPKILAMEKNNYLAVSGFKAKTADKIYHNIKKSIESVCLTRLMKASNIFGRGLGEKKMIPILEKYPSILVSQEPYDVLLNKLLTINGLGDKTAKLFLSNIEAFKVFMDESKLEYKLNNSEVPTPQSIDVSNPLFGKTIVFSGVRDKEVIKYILEHGGKIGSSVSKNTFKVVVKELDEDTGKANKGRALNILINIDEFKQLYVTQ
jgi:NAD-dependent DNA ligase